MSLTIIAAASLNNVIGKDGKLPWHISSDLARFKAITIGKTILMGRKTYESLPTPLRDRKIIVLSKTMSTIDDAYGENVVVIPRLSIMNPWDPEEIFVCGGSRIYEEILPACTRILLTRVHTVVEGAHLTYFSNLTKITKEWRIQKVDFPIHGDTKNEIATTYVEYRRPFTVIQGDRKDKKNLHGN